MITKASFTAADSTKYEIEATRVWNQKAGRTEKTLTVYNKKTDCFAICTEDKWGTFTVSDTIVGTEFIVEIFEERVSVIEKVLRSVDLVIDSATKL